jgi:hypothetical protein
MIPNSLLFLIFNLKISPVDKCLDYNFLLENLLVFLLPAPGLPNKIIFIFSILFHTDIPSDCNWLSQSTNSVILTYLLYYHY